MLTLTFDVQKSLAAKEHHKAAATVKRQILLCKARQLAREIALNDAHHRCRMDQVMLRLIQLGYSPKDLGNAAGSVFKTAEWVFAGWKPSHRVSNHHRQTMVWQWVE